MDSERKDHDRKKINEMDDFKMRKKMLLYNPKNKLLSRNDLDRILEIGGLYGVAQDIELYQRAFIHTSYLISQINADNEHLVCPNDCLDLQEESNERLEFLGDSIIGSVVTSYLFRRYPGKTEGFLTKLKIKLIKTKKLAELAQYLDFGPHLVISQYMEDDCEGRTKDTLLENTFEAFIGALYQDQRAAFDREQTTEHPYATCEKYIIELLEQTTDFSQLIAVDDNYKDQLLRYFQKTFNGNYPKYDVLQIDGSANQRIFTMGVYHPHDNTLLVGKGQNRKKVMAEQEASKNALIYFNALENILAR